MFIMLLASAWLVANTQKVAVLIISNSNSYSLSTYSVSTMLVTLGPSMESVLPEAEVLCL